ncbi:alpha/beta fold hydrolase [Leptobacterium flavescens]|uniref:Alpha/beta fold hydrolase n=1 Tax=Leptobacterium flavescens TaxID=472055 RepID=A0A6P0UKC5_9FLAO|nr:alpha/beta hydrolase [Leptobacterium flavescens]NER13417.1 alpha/beta fold hydrolase [Leptobacterium flavescens]
MHWSFFVLFALIIYILLNVAVYFLQERFIFKPEKLPEDFEFTYDNQVFDEYNIEVDEGVNINGVHFKVRRPKGVVLYLKGNSRSIKGWGKFAIDFTRLGFDVLMIDYRGFGKSTGRRTEEGIKKDLQYVYNRLKEQVDEKYIVLYGRSLGSGFATKLASNNAPRMLILDAPYYSLKHITKRYLPIMPMSLVLRFPIKTYKWIKYVECPIKIIHGTNDKLIPLKSSIKLSKINADLTRLYPVIDGGHNNLHTFPQYHRFLDEILHARLPKKIDPDTTSLNFRRNKKR